MSPRPLQVFFLHREGDLFILKCARRWIGMGIGLIGLGLFGVSVSIAFGAGWPALAVASALLLLGVNRLFSGPRSVVDVGSGTVTLHDGRQLRPEDFEHFEMRAVQDSDNHKAQTWCLLEAVTTTGERLTLGEGGGMQRVEAVGRELATRLGVTWQEPGAVERLRRKRFKRRLP